MAIVVVALPLLTVTAGLLEFVLTETVVEGVLLELLVTVTDGFVDEGDVTVTVFCLLGLWTLTVVPLLAGLTVCAIATTDMAATTHNVRKIFFI